MRRAMLDFAVRHGGGVQLPLYGFDMSHGLPECWPEGHRPKMLKPKVAASALDVIDDPL